MNEAVSDRVIRIIDKIETGVNIDEKLLKLTEKEVRRRISRYEITARNFERKYKTTFDEFSKKDMVNKLGHTWEAERDFFDWEMAVTELKELKATLKELGK